MARPSKTPKTTPEPAAAPLPMGSRQSTRVILVILGSVLLFGALVAPWWTRGMNVDEKKLYADADSGFDGFAFLIIPPGSEGIYLNYAPFHTPGSGSTSFDAGREAAVSVLGIALVATALFAAASLLLRWLMATGRVEHNANVPVRLAILAFIAGTFAVLWGAFFVPLAGDNPGMLYGREPSHAVFADSNGIVEDTRYANVGFFLGIAGAIGFPAFAWADAHTARAIALGDVPATTTTKRTTGTVTF